MDDMTCPRHPGTETRLRCSSCETLICAACSNEAPIGYHCPDCAAERRGGNAPAGSGRGRMPAWLPGQGGSGGSGGGEASDRMGRGAARGSGGTGTRFGGTGSGGPQQSTTINVRATVAALLGAVAGGLLLGPIFVGGTLFLISAGVIGWGVARGVYWATEERNSPYIRAIALTGAGFSVAVGLVTAGANAAPAGLLFLAYPAAMYGGWIVVRQR